ncbi:MAG: adenosylcobinamide-GDP ribazoletransferase [Deltaproteobacteria bacterium]|nr:MAG: adenosylcobinamide-GDP ribazoletransferase [Deltaproteobacteria bacterium]
MFRNFANAFSFLTIIPLFEVGEFDAKALARSMSAFPLVGLVLGGLLVAAHIVVGVHLPPLLEAVLLVTLLWYATGGFHLDGLADTMDGIWSGRGRERALEIMKDSRVGAHGASSMVLLILAKVAAIAVLPGYMKAAALIVAPSLGRGGVVLLAHKSLYARPTEGLASPYTEHLDANTVNTALLISGAISLVAGLGGVLAFLGVMGWALFLRKRFNAKMGGITGDMLGFCEETGEVIALILMVLAS